MSTEIEIRPWILADIPVIRDIARQTWLDTYQDIVPQADIFNYLETRYSTTSLTEQFTILIGYVALRQNRIVGYSLAEQKTSSRRQHIISHYVHPDFQNQGVGRALLKTQINRAKSTGWSEISLAAMVQNKPALAWYEKQGFRFDESAEFQMGATTVALKIGLLLIE